jgi:hypothetical protein
MGSLYIRLLTGQTYEPYCSTGKQVSPDQPQFKPERTNFNGNLALNNPIGTIWPNYAQAGALQISVDTDAVLGGCDNLRIVADGNAITLNPAFTWVNIGSDNIGTTLADVNELIFFAKALTVNGQGQVTGGTILYTCKLNP